jgi:hypothetical protein
MVPRELFRGEHVLAVRHGASVVLVEGVDDQRAVDQERRVAVGAVEHPAAAEASGGRAVGALGRRVGPDGHDAGRRLRLLSALEHGSDRRPHVHGRAARNESHQSQSREHTRMPKRGRHVAPFHLPDQLEGEVTAGAITGD